MTIDVRTPEQRAREMRNFALLQALRQTRLLTNEIGYLIDATPTGERRNTLTEVSVHLLALCSVLANLKVEND